MTTEEMIVDGFPSLWDDLAPWLESFVHDAGGHFLTKCFPDAIKSVHDSVGTAVINELAFSVSALAWTEGTHPRAIVYSHSDYPQLEVDALARVQAKIGDDVVAELPVGAEDEVLGIAIRLVWMLRARLLESPDEYRIVTFRCRLPGSSYVASVEADVLADRLLVEVKAGRRSIQGRDLKQLVLYAALAAEAERDIQSLGWVNPRLGLVFRMSLEEVARRMSGRSWLDLKGSLIAALGVTLSR